MLPLALAGAGVGIAGSIAGRAASGHARADAESAMNEAMSAIQNSPMPPDLSTPIILEKYKRAGVLTPELEQAILMGSSKMAEARGDKDAEIAQKQALSQFQKRAKVGLTAEDRAALSQIDRQTAVEDSARRQALMNQMAARGQAGGSAELAAQLQAQQQAQDAQAQASMATGANASRRALEAMGQASGLAGQIRGSSFDEASRRAEAADALARFDVGNQRDVQSRNIGSKNVAQQFNLSALQRAEDLNVGEANQEKRRQVEAKRQHWQDTMQRAGMMSGAAMGRANYLGQQAADTQGFYSGLGQAIGGGMGSAANYMGQQNQIEANRAQVNAEREHEKSLAQYNRTGKW